MKELLEKFVALAPDGWDCEWAGCRDSIWISGFDISIFLAPQRRSGRSLDFRNSEAIVFLLDYLESQEDGGMAETELYPAMPSRKYCPNLRFNGGQRCYWCCLNAWVYPGKTRIEALVRACIALWEAR